MSGLAFFDTNIFLSSDDSRSPEKQTQALRLITEHQRSGMAMLYLQVLQEYFAAATLYSEDLQAGRDWAGLRVVNPFHSK